MAGSVNKVILIGNLGRDPDVRHGQSRAKIVSLSVATSESWKDRESGERREKTEWHRVVIFDDRLADLAEQYLRKGSKVFLSGQLQTRKWTDNAGTDRYTTEVVLNRFRGELTMLDSKRDGPGVPDGEDDYGGSDVAGDADRGGSGGSGASGGGDLDDEIPF